ncbi:hypothetical protein [Methanoculleus methanifontis]|nr:hypothetical protein [Methanoculleus sp. FWC-SCC3]
MSELTEGDVFRGLITIAPPIVGRTCCEEILEGHRYPFSPRAPDNVRVLA